MKKLLLTTAFGFLATAGFAQGITFGLTTGVNSTFVLDKGLREDPRYLPQATYHWAPVGMSVGLNLSPRFGLQLEAIKNTAGQVYHIIDVYEKHKGQREMVMEYLSLPLLLKFMDNELTKTANFNFMIGPQLSLLMDGYESIQYESGTYAIPEGGEAPAGAEPNGDGTYNAPAQDYRVLADKNGGEDQFAFNNTDLQLVANFGIRFRLSPKLSINTDLRGNYSFTDFRSQEFIQQVKDGTANVNDMFGRRANLLVGLQLGLNYYIGF